MDKLTDNQQDYYDLELLLTSKMYDDSKNKIKDVEKQQDESKKKLLILLLALIGKLSDNDILQLSDNDIKKNKIKINTEINSLYDNEYQNELNMLNDTLENVVTDSYYMLGYLELIGINGYKFDKLGDIDKNKLLNEKIDDKTYKDRLQANKKSIYDVIKTELNSFLLGTLTVKEIKNVIERDFKTNLSNSTRLFNDQINRVSNNSKGLFRDNNNINQVIYCSVLCPNTCDICRNNHGKIYDTNDNNKPSLPRHINCYCYYTSVVDTKWENNSNQNVDYNSFKHWLNEFLGGEK